VNVRRDAGSPADTWRAFVAALNSGDVVGAAAVYRDDAVMATKHETRASGSVAIQDLLTELVAAEVDVEVRVKYVIEAGDVAAAFMVWAMRRDRDGWRREQTGQSIAIFVRAGGTWRVVIACSL
jgi:ketosteroid isomerase-like protein